MRCTETEKSLLLKQLRKARDEVVRSLMMMKAVSDDETDDESVEDLAEMAASLDGHIESIVKSKLLEDEDRADAGDDNE